MKPLMLNLGCGSVRWPGWTGVDAYGEPDVKHDLNVAPYPWPDDSVDQILASHVFEHLSNWWGAFLECVRILKPGGILEIRVPDESNSDAGCYRDHLHIFRLTSFQGVEGTHAGTNAWAAGEPRIPLKMIQYARMPHQCYEWMQWIPGLMRFCADHMRNFIHEQRFTFQKTSTASSKEYAP